MSKEFSALERFKNIKYAPAFFGIANDKELSKDCDIIEEALQRLEAIENSKPSEALESLEEIRDFRYGKDKLLVCQTAMYKTIKQALIKAQEQENVIRILFEKNVRIYWIKSYSCVKSYNNGLPKKEQLTQEEFELLKRCFENESR